MAFGETDVLLGNRNQSYERSCAYLYTLLEQRFCYFKNFNSQLYKHQETFHSQHYAFPRTRHTILQAASGNYLGFFQNKNETPKLPTAPKSLSLSKPYTSYSRTEPLLGLVGLTPIRGFFVVSLFSNWVAARAINVLMHHRGNGTIVRGLVCSP